MDENFVLWPYPYLNGTIVGYFPEMDDDDQAREYLSKQTIVVNSPVGRAMVYPTDYELVHHKGILILVCNCGIIKAHWRGSRVFQISLEKALDEYITQFMLLKH